jgi:hypothetical protein
MTFNASRQAGQHHDINTQNSRSIGRKRGRRVLRRLSTANWCCSATHSQTNARRHDDLRGQFQWRYRQKPTIGRNPRPAGVTRQRSGSDGVEEGQRDFCNKICPKPTSDRNRISFDSKIAYLSWPSCRRGQAEVVFRAAIVLSTGSAQQGISLIAFTEILGGPPWLMSIVAPSWLHP